MTVQTCAGRAEAEFLTGADLMSEERAGSIEHAAKRVVDDFLPKLLVTFDDEVFERTAERRVPLRSETKADFPLRMANRVPECTLIERAGTILVLCPSSLRLLDTGSCPRTSSGKLFLSASCSEDGLDKDTSRE